MKKQSNTPANELRRLLRMAMQTAPDRPWTVAMITDAVKKLTPLDVDDEDLKHAIQWNHDKALIDYTHDQELDVRKWKLTDAGKAATA